MGLNQSLHKFPGAREGTRVSVDRDQRDQGIAVVGVSYLGCIQYPDRTLGLAYRIQSDTKDIAIPRIVPIEHRRLGEGFDRGLSALLANKAQTEGVIRDGRIGYARDRIAKDRLGLTLVALEADHVR